MTIMRARTLVFLGVVVAGRALRAPSAVGGPAPRALRLPRGGRLHAANNNNNINPFASLFASPPFAIKPPRPAEGAAAAAARRYFAAWNRRDMAAAVREFDSACVYEDTQYAGAFVGKVALAAHLDKVAACLPASFVFVLDEVADGGAVVGVQWHVESASSGGDGTPLPFARGCSVYKADPATGLLISGFDVPEPAPLKPGSAGLELLSFASKLIAEPVRLVPLATWLAYVYFVFFSHALLPGPDVTQLDPATWAEVLGLSLNFGFVAPLLHLPFSPVLHPGLEAIFNLLLAWAAAFAAFASDGRAGRQSGSMLPTLLGMQALTNAVLLPYLVLRAPEDDDSAAAAATAASSSTFANAAEEASAQASSAGVAVRGYPAVHVEDLSGFEQLCESPFLGVGLAAWGAAAIGWGAWARADQLQFGADLPARLASLAELLAGDRVGTSFVLDLVLFALFQGWLVDDDLGRRGAGPGTARGAEVAGLRAVAKSVPFFGLCAYSAFRPPLPSRAD